MIIYLRRQPCPFHPVASWPFQQHPYIGWRDSQSVVGLCASVGEISDVWVAHLDKGRMQTLFIKRDEKIETKQVKN